MSRPIINTHDQLTVAGGGVAIVASHSLGRDRYFKGWAIYRVNAKGRPLVTDTQAHWSDQGRKVFSTFGSTRMEALAEAKAWVAEQFGYDGKWTRNRLGAYVPTEIHKKFPLRRQP